MDKIKRNKNKEIIATVIAKTIYYIINVSVFLASILLFFAVLGAVVEICTSSTIVCVCFIIVCSYSIFRMILKEI